MTDTQTRKKARMAPANGNGPRVLVTGAAGMLGRALVRELQAQGVWVRGTDRVSGQEVDMEDYVQCDLADAKALEEICEGCGQVVHLGGVSGPGFVFDPPIPTGTVARTNITGTLNVLEAARLCGVKRVVFSSSVIAYWPVDRTTHSGVSALTESAPVDSTETYGASKIAGEQLCRAYSAQGLLDTVSLRIGWVYGPGRTTGCLIKAMLNGVPLDTPPEHRRDFVFVDDVARALALAALREKRFGGIALNVSGAHISHATIESAVEAALGAKVKSNPPSETTIDPPLPPMDLSAAQRELGWAPQVTIKDGVQRYAAHLELRHKDQAAVRGA